MTSVSIHLWFDHQAAAAVGFYTSIFDDSEVFGDVAVHDGDPGRDQDVHIIDFRIGEMRISAFNGGPHSEFNEAISLAVVCDHQEEVDRYWAAFSDGGEPIQCGWIKDRFGLHWQVVPRLLPRLLADRDRAKAKRVMEAMVQMTKIDVAAIEAAAQQSES